LNQEKFKQGSAQIYIAQYFGPGKCNNLPQPYVCKFDKMTDLQHLILITSFIILLFLLLLVLYDYRAFYVCADIAVNSGVGRSAQFLGKLGAVGSDAKAYAKKLNEMHRQFYKQIGVGKNAKFLKGWLARAASRDAYITNYKY